MSMVTVDQALETILAKIKFKGVEKIPIGESLGRTLTEDIVAKRNNPPLDNSAMDGYALIAKDIQSATPENPVPLKVTEEIAAGYQSDSTLKSGQAFRIMTGAPIPKGANAVLMQEDTDRNGDTVLVKDKAEVGENVQAYRRLARARAQLPGRGRGSLSAGYSEDPQRGTESR